MEDWMLDDDDDYDDDDSVGVSVGDVEFACDDGVAPHGKSGFFQDRGYHLHSRGRWLREVRILHAAGSGRSRFFVCLSYVVCSAAVAVSSLLSSVLSFAVVVNDRVASLGCQDQRR